MATVSRPVIVLPEYTYTLEEICDLVADVHSDKPRLDSFLEVMRHTQVWTRSWIRPAKEVLATSRLGQDLSETFEALCALGVQAAFGALAAAGVDPVDIDAVIVASVSGYKMPGPDVAILNALIPLGLRPDVRRRPVTTVGCAGGAHALSGAAEFLRAHPGSPGRPRRVLVVCTEAFSSVLQPTDTGKDAMIYKVLGGDAAAACVVTDDPDASGLRIEETWSYLMPGTADAYRLFVDELGLHFYSTSRARHAAAQAMPHVSTQLERHTEAGWPVEFMVSHTGGPAILHGIATGLGVEAGDAESGLLRHSWASLGRIGNCGSGSVLDVLADTFQDPPAAGSRGLLLGIGPGVALEFAAVTWTGDRHPSVAEPWG